MLRSNTNIIGYLQKKAFFTKSPKPSPSPNSRFATSPSPNKNVINSFKHISNFTPSSSKGKIKTFNKTNATINVQEKQVINSYNNQLQSNCSSDHVGNIPKIYSKRLLQSSRVQVKAYVDQLLGRITAQLRMLEGAITEMTVSLQSIFYRKLNQLKQQLLQNVDKIFAKARNNLSNILNKNSEDHLKKLLKARHMLSSADQKLKKLKYGMENNWRRVAGELLLEQYDQKIEHLLQDSEVTRKKVAANHSQIGNTKQQGGWQSVQKCVQALIQKKCS